MSSSLSKETNLQFVLCVITRSPFQSSNSMSGSLFWLPLLPSSRAVLIPPGAHLCRRLLLAISQAPKNPGMLLTIEPIPYSHPMSNLKPNKQTPNASGYHNSERTPSQCPIPVPSTRRQALNRRSRARRLRLKRHNLPLARLSELLLAPLRVVQHPLLHRHVFL